MMNKIKLKTSGVNSVALKTITTHKPLMEYEKMNYGLSSLLRKKQTPQRKLGFFVFC